MVNTWIIAILRLSAPILLCAVGSLFCDRAGVTNISLEGTMLLAAFMGVFGSYYSGSWIIGILCAVAAGVLASLFFALITLKFGGAELVVGFTMNVLLDGLTVFMLRSIFKVSGSLVSEKVIGVPSFTIPGLTKIPVIGGFVTDLNILVVLAFISVFLAHFIFKRTHLGLKVLSSGENPQAAATVGINVYGIRLLALVITGVLCGLAGAQLSLGYLSMFTEGMTAGRGFIALVAVMFARGSSMRVLLVTLLFGAAEMMSNYLQLFQYSSYLILMIPYLCVILLTLLQLILEQQGKKKRMISAREKTA
ncbi:ABC transporter permease [Youxingia wuxianensis]|uniref:ABC transporter permease n=1 Tax=Youxingia wuxianensis TaxID=2763678 RepID=A0A926IGZ5_9FIRM|nr:ABC transporter permease [Youxingia wuxianensis]MBC8584188.1 ABC transporter permease [Youxingia wuxianensis]